MSSIINNDEIEDFHRLIGHNVKRMREQKKFTQIQLSLAIGQKSTTIISQAELGRNKHFNIEQLYKIAKILECKVSDFCI